MNKYQIPFPKCMDQIDLNEVSELIERTLKEDLGEAGDLTSQALMAGNPPDVSAKVIAKESGVICGLPLFLEVYRRIDPNLKLTCKVKDGDSVGRMDTVVELFGNPASITSGERSALNFLGLLSGVSTKARHLSDVLKGTPTRLLDTRKTIPGLRNLQKYAVHMGGGCNHRIGLYDMILIKENHIAAAGGVTRAVELAKGKYPEILVEVELESLEQVREALNTKAEVFMLDNMNNDMVKEALKIIDDRRYVEVSGNVDEKRLRELGEIGVDFVSMGALTHTVKPLDLSLLIG